MSRVLTTSHTFADARASVIAGSRNLDHPPARLVFFRLAVSHDRATLVPWSAIFSVAGMRRGRTVASLETWLCGV
jgi:hypothetical protein